MAGPLRGARVPVLTPHGRSRGESRGLGAKQTRTSAGPGGLARCSCADTNTHWLPAMPRATTPGASQCTSLDHPVQRPAAAGVTPSPYPEPRGVPLFGGELVTPRPHVRNPYAELHNHRLCFAVDHNLLAVPARRRAVRAFSFRPLREGCQAPLERLLRLARALRRGRGRRGGRRGRRGLDAQRGQPLLLLCDGALIFRVLDCFGLVFRLWGWDSGLLEPLRSGVLGVAWGRVRFGCSGAWPVVR